MAASSKRRNLGPQNRLPKLDASSALCDRLLFASASVGGRLFDAVSQRFDTRASHASLINDDGQHPLYSAGTPSDFAAPVKLDGAGPITILWKQRAVSPTGYSGIIDVRPPLNSSYSLLIYQSATDTSYQFVVGWRDGGGNGKQARFPIGLQVDGREDSFSLTLPNGYASSMGDMIMVKNGVVLAPAVTGPDFGAASPTGLRIGGILGATSDPHEGAVYDVRIFGRALSVLGESVPWTAGEIDVWAPRRRAAPTIASSTPSFTHSASGGIQFSGAASTTFTCNFATAASGGLKFGGTAAATFSRAFAAIGSGGLTFGGTASASADAGFVVTGSGGPTFGGTTASAYSANFVASAAGGIVFGGAAGAAVSAYYGHGAAGGLSFGGAAVSQVDIGYSATGTGGFTFGGSASATAAYGFAQVSSGGLAFGGTGAASFAASSYAYGGSGGLVFGGSAWSSGPAATKPQESGGGGSKRQDPHPARTRNRRIDASRTAEIYARNQQIVQAIVALVTSGALDAMTAE